MGLIQCDSTFQQLVESSTYRDTKSAKVPIHRDDITTINFLMENLAPIKYIIMKLFVFDNMHKPANLYLVAPDFPSALQLILKQRKKLVESYNPIVSDLVAIKNRKMPINDFVLDVTVNVFPLDKPDILISYVQDGFRDILTGDIVSDKELIAALQQIGGIYRPFVVPKELQELQRTGSVADTLVICHGRASRGLHFPGFNPDTAWFADRDRRVNPDLVVTYEDLPIEEMPKFRRVIFVYCPAANFPPEYESAFDFADDILVTGGSLIYVLPVLWNDPENKQNLEDFEQFAQENGWNQQPDINITLDDTTARGAVFIKPRIRLLYNLQ